ncbi:MAG: ArsR/SmtB family transcription factor [Jatrophihabitans sp.]|uniref:ArsR/SmtB family transcription factor n=1 Tax=Jatrophihabitans sp. TaxID=1932789 RepID=UPI003F7D895E
MANASELLDVLSEPTRRQIVERLAGAPSSVTELADGMTITRSAVSQHLQLLKSVGLVSDRREGTRRIYSVDPDALAILRSYFESFWQRSLQSFQRAAATTEETT